MLLELELILNAELISFKEVIFTVTNFNVKLIKEQILNKQTMNSKINRLNNKDEMQCKSNNRNNES